MELDFDFFFFLSTSCSIYGSLTQHMVCFTAYGGHHTGPIFSFISGSSNLSQIHASLVFPTKQHKRHIIKIKHNWDLQLFIVLDAKIIMCLQHIKHKV